MAHYLQILKDTLENNYLGIVFPIEEVQPFLNQLKDYLGESYDEYINLQQTRDHGKYHLTLLSVPEFNSRSKEMGYDKFLNHLENLMKVNFDDIKLLGVGSAEKSGNRAFYIVVKSDLLNESRTALNLDEKDLHITLGFKSKDVQGVRKNDVMPPQNSFLKKLKFEYMNEGETFDFIKGLQNFDFDFFKLIEPIQINETNAIFRCGDNDYLQVSLVDDRLTITGKWQETNKLPILSTTLVEKKFKQLD